MPIDKRHPVVASLDLGHNDLMPVLFAQEVGGMLRVFHTECYRFTSIPDMVEHWRELPFSIDLLCLPHDSKVRDLTSGKTRQEIFEGFGIATTVAPNVSLFEGIEQGRQWISQAMIDADNAMPLFEAMAMYRSDMDEDNGVTKLQPVHDWASHWADAWRYLVLSNRSVYVDWGKQDLSGLVL